MPPGDLLFVGVLALFLSVGALVLVGQYLNDEPKQEEDPDWRLGLADLDYLGLTEREETK